MKTISLSELDLLVEDMQALVGAQLQGVSTNDRLVVLNLRGVNESFSLVFDLDARQPTVVFGEPIKIKKNLKPIANFLRSHFLNQRISKVFRLKGFGRVLVIETASGCCLEFRAYPRGQNLIANANKMQISWTKPKDLVPVENEKLTSEEPLRSSNQLYVEWKQNFFQIKGGVCKKEVENLFEKKRKKLLRAIEKVEKDLHAKETTPWQQVGEWVVRHQSLGVPEEFKEYIDHEKGLSENIQYCFKKAKENKNKIEGTRFRLVQLKKDLEQLNMLEVAKQQSEPKQKVNFAGQVKTRKLTLETGIEVYWGKSARENAEILRKAKPWYLWFHLKDTPGAHAVLVRNKNQKITFKQKQQVGEWLCHVTLGEKVKKVIGDRFELLVASCRYVRPIKGDKVGRVHYTNEEVLSFKLSQ